MKDEAPSQTEAPEPGWRIFAGDYGVGVIRLVTLVENGVNHLLFASVELLPTEMPPPPAIPNGGFSQNFGPMRLCVGRTVMPVAEALDWYRALWRGACVVPRKSFPVAIGALAPEPGNEVFILPAGPPPFSPGWHAVPRLHRLVPMGELAVPIVALRDGASSVEAKRRARAWLCDHVHFDLVAYDDWLGGAVLIAPNPLLRSCGTRIAARSQAGETIEVGGPRRRGADLSSLEILIEEQRAGASGWRAEGPTDPLGRFRATAPTEVDRVRHEVVCQLRGLLDQHEPGHFFRSVWTGSAGLGRTRLVEPPRRAADTPSKTVYLRPVAAGPPEPPPTALRQLRRLQRSRDQRTGDRQPAEAPSMPSVVYLLEDDRAAAVDRVQRLIAQARSHILFVDPYFDADDLQEFAMAAEHEGVAVRALINPRPGRNKRGDGASGLLGDALIEQIARMRDPKQGFGEIDIRVSGARRLHDRFLQIDDQVWHCGHSFNQIGQGEISLMTQVAQSDEIREALADAFAVATPFEDYWVNRVIPPRTIFQAVADGLRSVAARLDRLGAGSWSGRA